MGCGCMSMVRLGALAALSERFREPMLAIGLADSVSLDPHKFLFTSFEAGCVLVRDEATLRHSFNFSPSLPGA